MRNKADYDGQKKTNIKDAEGANIKTKQVLNNLGISLWDQPNIYNFEKAWKKILLRLNKNLASQYGKGINMEFD